MEFTEKYGLSRGIRLEFIEGGHEFVLASPDCAHIPLLIAEFALGAGGIPPRSASFDEEF